MSASTADPVDAAPTFLAVTPDETTDDGDTPLFAQTAAEHASTA